ncbi:MAG: HNH endonuclease [Dehalococcoidia bacterium]
MSNEAREAVIQALEEAGFSRGSAIVGLERGFRCAYCCRQLLVDIDSYDLWENDHLRPLSKGGIAETENLVLACRLCNKIKGNWEPADSSEWSREQMILAVRKHVEEGRDKKRSELKKVLDILAKGGVLPGLSMREAPRQPKCPEEGEVHHV